MTKQEKLEVLGISIHTAFRKGCDSKYSMTAWRAINKMDKEGQWMPYLHSVLYYLKASGFFRKSNRSRKGAA